MLHLLILAVIVIASGCENPPEVRHYKEITIQVADMPQPTMSANMDMSQMPAMPTANAEVKNKITYDVPKGWVEQPGGAMRLSTLRLKDNFDLFDCSIIALPGGAGGLEANLKRWMGQINLNPKDEDFARFMEASSKSNIFDFTQLQLGGNKDDKSMIAAMINIDGTTIFIKFNSTISVVKEYRATFLNLVKSVKRK